MKALTLLCFLFFLNFPKTFSQYEAALPFLYNNPSPELTGLGWTGVSLPNDNPFGFYYNPANLGFFAQENNLAVEIYPGAVERKIYPGAVERQFFGIISEVNSFGVNLGYNLKKEFGGFNFSAGAGFIHTNFKYDLYDFFNEQHSYDAFGLGTSINYYISFSAGFTYKATQSRFGGYETDASSIDYGFLLTLPFMRLINVNIIALNDEVQLNPIVNYSLGYSRLNIGDEVYYIDPAQGDPLPLNARLGHTFSFGLDLKNDNIDLNLIIYDLILEADDILFSKTLQADSTFKTSYQGMLGDIDFGKHLIQLKSDDKVVVHKGHAINLGETVKILIGRFNGRYYDSKTNGFVISGRGLFKFISFLSKDKTMKFMADHFDIRYIKSTNYIDSSMETDYSGISFYLINFPFLN